VSDELAKGAYAEKGPVMIQLKKFNKDAEIPTFEVEVDPWQRYEVLAKEAGDSWKDLMKDEKWVHPKVQKELNKAEYYTKKGMSKTGEFKYAGKTLVSIGGKVPAGGGSGGGGGGTAPPTSTFTPMKRTPSIVKGPQLGDLVKANKVQIVEKAEASQASLHDSVLSSKIEDHVQTLRKQNSTVAEQAARRKSTRDDLANVSAMLQTAEGLGEAAASPDVGEVEQAEASWNRMSGKHLSVSQQAELAQVRHQIEALEKSLATYRQAEKNLLMSK
jgi:hypothetical protein